MAGHLVTASGTGNTSVAVQPAMFVQPVVLVTFAGAFVTPGSSATAAPGLVTGSASPNAVVAIRAGLQVQPVVVVDGTGSFVYA
jgi:hypothetical protein